jgi:AAA+ ATPase superfamily predicted ATPase
MTFHDRMQELESLKKEYNTGSFSLFVIYGRRRVGKTELIKKFCEERDSIYHLVSQDTPKLQRERLNERIAEKFEERPPRTENWRETVEYTAEKLNQEKLVMALDEFQYIIEQDENAVSQFQYLVDELINENSESMLIISGSTVSVIENQVLGYDSPLYGRRTGQIDLKPFNFRESLRVIDYPFQEAIESYSITGGTPLYLETFNYSKTLEENIKQKILNPASTLFEEPEFLLRQELRNPSRYMSILESIATGYTTPNEISGNTGIESSTLTKYLDRLRKLRLIKREKPVTASKNSKRSIYRIEDNFLNFWFKNIAPRKSMIEQNPGKALENIKKDLKHQTAETFEQVSRELLGKTTDYPEIGRWWYREQEIDIAAINSEEDRLLLGECKWTSSKTGEKVFQELKQKAEKVRWRQKDRKLEYRLFSKSGFTEQLEEKAQQRKDLALYSLETMRTEFEAD